MQAIQKVQVLVHIFDHRCVDFYIDIPDSLKFDKLLPSVLEQHMPPLSVRISNLAFTICYKAFQKNNPTASVQEFQETFLTTFAGVTAYQEALVLAEQKVKKDITVGDIEGLYKAAARSVDSNS